MSNVVCCVGVCGCVSIVVNARVDGMSLRLGCSGYATTFTANKLNILSTFYPNYMHHSQTTQEKVSDAKTSVSGTSQHASPKSETAWGTSRGGG